MRIAAVVLLSSLVIAAQPVASGQVQRIAQGPSTAVSVDQSDSAEWRMSRRFPQAVRVGDLIGLPVLDENSRTLGYVRAVVRTPQNKIELIVDYDGWLGWDARPVAVPVEVIGIQGRELASLDMPRADYEAAPKWQKTDETPLPLDSSVRVALARR